ncbi:MAG: hypothetical protein WBB34_13825 [Xanthobacteraceae bacterium]
MALSFESIVIIGDALVLPAAMAAAVPLYSEWVRKMRGSRAIQTVALLIIVLAVGMDAVDRLGILWPSPSQVAGERDRADTAERTQAALIDDLRTELAAAPTKPIGQTPVAAVPVQPNSPGLRLGAGNDNTFSNVHCEGLSPCIDIGNGNRNAVNGLDAKR